jgi:tetratricopeptide (TPR) repeat protein
MSNLKQAAEVLEKKNDWKGALAIYQQLYNADENGDIEILQKIGWCQSKAEFFAEAAATFKELITCEPKVAKWYYMAGAQYFALKQWVTSVDFLRKAVTLLPEYFVAKYKCGCALLELAGDEYSMRNPEVIEAVAYFDSCRSLWKKMVPEQQKRNLIIGADVFLRRGKIYLMGKEYSNAVACLKQSVTLVPNAWESKYQLAKAYSESGDQSAALKSLPDIQRPFVRELRVLILIRKGETEKGLALFKECLRTRRRDYLLGEIAEIFLQKMIYQLPIAMQCGL